MKRFHIIKNEYADEFGRIWTLTHENGYTLWTLTDKKIDDWSDVELVDYYETHSA